MDNNPSETRVTNYAAVGLVGLTLSASKGARDFIVGEKNYSIRYNYRLNDWEVYETRWIQYNLCFPFFPSKTLAAEALMKAADLGLLINELRITQTR